MTIQSKPSHPADEDGPLGPKPTSWKALYGVNTAEIAQQIHKLKLVPAVALISGFLNADSFAAKAGFLYSLAALFTQQPPLELILKFSNRFDDIATFFATLQLGGEARPKFTEVRYSPDEDGVVFQAIEEACDKNSSVEIDLSRDKPLSIGNILVENTGTVKFFVGAIATLCALFGVTSILRLEDGATLLSNIKQLSSLVLSGKNIISGMKEFLDACLPTIYSLFGVEYISDEYKAVKELGRKVDELYAKALEYARMLKVDFFGTQLSALTDLEKQYQRLNAEHMSVITTTRSTYNFSTRLNQIDTIIREVHDIITDVYKARGGKQRPVVVWFCGRAGIGKSYMASKFSQRLASRDNSSVYSRTPADEYWSGYRFQTVVYFDDMGQITNEQRDIHEFMRYTGNDAKDVICADIPNKGNSFVSKYMVCTSNNIWIAPPVALADFEAPNRRRDAVVYVHFPQLADYKARHSGAEPPSDWFETNHPRLFLVNPTWGHTLERSNSQHNLKFSTDEDWVIREISMDELFERTVNLQNMRAETFRSHILSIKEYEGVINVPKDPIPFDPKMNFSFPQRKGSSIVYTPEYVSHDLDIDDFTHVFKGSIDEFLKIHKLTTVSSNWEETLARKLEAPLLVSKKGKYSLFNSTRIVDDAVPLRFWRSTLVYYLHYSSSNNTTVEIYSSKIDDVEPQGNPLCTIKQVNTAPAIVIKGPPGTGKTYLVAQAVPAELLYHVKYTKNEELPKGKVLFLDDISIDKKRIQIAKKLIQDFHTNPQYKLIICTLNEETEAWKNTMQDEKDLLLRRAHVITATYTNWLIMRTTFSGQSPADFIKQFAERDSYIQWYFSLFPKRGKEIESLKPSQASVQSLILEELRNGVMPSEMTQFNEIALPHHPSPDIRIFLTNEQDINSKSIKVLVRRNGEYVLPSACEFLSIIQFAMQFEPYLRGTITDRHQIPTSINKHQIQNKTTYQTCMLAIGSYTMCIETVSGLLFAYSTEDGDCGFAIEDDAIIWDGKVYPVENNIDKAVYEALQRAALQPKVTAQKLQWQSCSVPDIQTYWTSRNMTRFIAQVIGFAEIAVQFGLSFAMLSDAQPKMMSTIKRILPEKIQHEGTKGKTHYKEKNYDGGAERADELTYDNDRKQEKSRSKRGSNYDTSSGQMLSPTEIAKINKFIDSQVQAGAKTIVVPNQTFTRPGYNTRYDAERNEWVLVKIEGPLHEAVQPEGQSIGCFPVQVHHTSLGHFHGVEEAGLVYFPHATQRERQTIFCIHSNDKNIVTKTRLKWEGCPHDCNDHDRRSLHLNSLIGQNFENVENFDVQFVGHCLGHANLPQIKVKLADKANHLSAPRQEGAFDTEATVNLARTDNTHRVNIFVDEKFFCAGLMVKENIGLSVAHIRPDNFKIQFTYSDNQELYNAKVIRRAKQNDVLAFKVVDQGFPRVRDITKKFVTNDSLSDHLNATRNQPAISVMLSEEIPNGKRFARLVQAEAQSYVICEAHQDAKGAIEYSNRIGYHGYTGVTKAGDCGSLGTLMAPTLNHKFCGIHSRGRNDVSILAPLSQEYITWITGENQEVPQGMKEVPHKYLEYGIAYQDQHGFDVFAEPIKPVFTPTGTTDYKSGIEMLRKHEPTIKSRADPRNILRRDFLEEGIGRYNTKLPKVEDLQERANFAARSIGEYLATLMLGKKMHTRILSNTEAINGTSKAEFPSTKPLERTGSVGFPYNILSSRVQKGDYLAQNPRNQHWYFTKDQEAQRILSDASRYFEDAKQGIEHHHVWAAYLKDEPVGLKKIYNLTKQKTRIFFAGSMSYQMAYRRAFGAALWRITDLHLQIPVRVGIRARDIEWQTLAQEHLKISSLGFDSDFENWDGTVPIEFLRAVVIIYNIIYKATDPNWQPEDDVLRETLHRAVEGARVIVRNRVVKLVQAMASGFPGTAIENSLINWMLYFLCYLECVPKQYQTFAHFMQLVGLSVYGDDNMATVAPQIMQYFHFNVFKTVTAKFGFKATDAAKQGGEQPNLKPFTELQFLKRGFVKDGWQYKPVIEEDSISKMVEWIRNSKAYEYRGHWYMNNTPGVYEASFLANLQEVILHGEEYYNKFVELVLPQIRHRGYKIIIPTYQELQNQIC